jgi:hypothetical protein
MPSSWSTRPLPALPLSDWAETKHTLHLYLQIIGKVRLAGVPKQNHWWHAPLYVTPRGLTTRLIPYGTGGFAIDVDMSGSEPTDHAVRVETSGGAAEAFALREGTSVAAFYRRLFGALDALGITADIKAAPYDHPTSTTPFPDDEAHAQYDADAVARFHRILVWTHGVMEQFRGRFLGKSSPVHLFWHSFDLAVTRFSGRPAPGRPDDPVAREAYSHEVVSFGFWAGDDTTPEPAFYSYTYPEPNGLADAGLAPSAARWRAQENGALAVLPYAAVRAADDPQEALLDFLESSYRAGADLAGWDLDGFARNGTDAVRPRTEEA